MLYICDPLDVAFNVPICCVVRKYKNSSLFNEHLHLDNGRGVVFLLWGKIVSVNFNMFFQLKISVI